MEKWETQSQDCVAELLRVITSSCRHELLMRVTWIWDTTSSFRMRWRWQTRGTRTDPEDWTSEDAGFRSVAVCWETQPGWLAGWLAGRTATWKTDWASRDGVYPPPTNPLTVNRPGGQCRRQSSLPSAALLGVCSADSDWGERWPFQLHEKTLFFPSQRGWKGHGAVADWGG